MRAATQTQTPEHRPSVGWAGCSSTPSHSMAAEKTKEAKAKSAAGGKKKVRRGPNAHRATAKRRGLNKTTVHATHTALPSSPCERPQ